MNTKRKVARVAGLLYLVVVITGIINLAWIPAQLIVPDNAPATVQKIINQEMLFRWGIISALICYIAFLLLPFALYKLLHSVNINAARLMIIFAVVSIPVSLINLQSKFSILNLIGNVKKINGPGGEEIQNQVMLHLQAYSSGNQIASIFWGLWLLPLGYLVFKSGFLPKILGILLMVGCFGYLINFIGNFLFEGYEKSTLASFITKPGSIGEIGICLWLLIVGVKKNKQPVTILS